MRLWHIAILAEMDNHDKWMEEREWISPLWVDDHERVEDGLGRLVRKIVLSYSQPVKAQCTSSVVYQSLSKLCSHHTESH